MDKKYSKFLDSNEIGNEPVTKNKPSLPEDFKSSVEIFSANDVENVVVIPRKRRTNSFSFAHIFVLLICAATFVFSGYKLIEWKISTDKADAYYGNLQGLFNKQSAVEAPKTIIRSAAAISLSDLLSGNVDDTIFLPPEKLSYFEEMLNKLNRIKSIAARPSEVYGWLKVSGTASIDYPIMKTKNNDYYLSKLPDGTTSSSGSIFADYRGTNTHIDNPHVVLYGHNMGDGSMFRDLRYFYWPSKVLSKYKNTEVEVITEDGIYIYKVFSMYTATTGNYYIRYEFANDAEYVEFLQDIYNQNMFYGYDDAIKMSKYISANTKLLTLSTCTSNHIDPNERFVLHCVLVEKIEP